MGKPLRLWLPLLVVCLGLPSPPARAASPGEWEWMVAPYAWGASLGTDLETRQPPFENEREFDSIIDKIDGAFQIHIEGQGDRFGMFTDFTYLSLADHKDFQRAGTRSDLDSRLFEIAAVWRPGQRGSGGLEVFAGLRYIDLDLSVRFDPFNPLFEDRRSDVDRTYSDFMAGIRYTWATGERWRWTLRGDGSVGDTDGTWNVSGMGQYRVKYGSWLFGYRHLSVEVEDGDSRVDITLDGPMVGFGFAF